MTDCRCNVPFDNTKMSIEEYLNENINLKLFLLNNGYTIDVLC